MSALPIAEDGPQPKRNKGKPLVLYRFFDAQDNLLYVGITNSPHTRFNSHRSDKSWFKNVVRSTMEHFPTRAELEAAEISVIRTEKPRYNIAHSVASPPKQIHVKPRVGYTGVSRDANRFPKPDGIASDDPTEDEAEIRLDELELQIAKNARLTLPMQVCPSCEYMLLVREYDGLIKCLNCLGMWLPEEIPSDFEILKQRIREKA